MDQDSRLLHKLTSYSATDAYPFHMPGHKRSHDIPGLEPFFDIDITEIDGFDNLHRAEGILLEIQKQAAELYQAKDAFISVNGSTCGVLAAMMSQIPRGDTVILGRGAHKSAYHGLYLQQLTPIYLQADTLPFQIPGAVAPGQIANAMDEHPEAKAVVLTSPTYEGLLLDVEKIAEEVHRRDGILIVDSAHGAHLGFAHCMEKNPVNLGADLVIVSLHKTMPAMTQTALVLVGSDRVDVENLKLHLGILQTSSPSYVLMASIQESLLYAAKYGEEGLARMAESRKTLTTAVRKQCKHVLVVDGQNDLGTREKWDPGKLVITTLRGEMTGPAIYQYLRQEHNLQLEMATGTYALAMLSMMDKPEAYKRLLDALVVLDRKIETNEIKETLQGDDISDDEITLKSNDSLSQDDMEKKDFPKTVIPLWKALNQAGTEMPLEEAVGKVVGSFVGLYPPGIPMLVPGEKMDRQRYEEITDCLKRGLQVQGLVEKQGGLYLKTIPVKNE